jgi:hypothetical protein
VAPGHCFGVHRIDWVEFELSRESVCYADRINSDGEAVLTCAGVQYTILCQMFEEICLRMLQDNIACFQGLHLSFVQFDVFVLLWSASL